MTEIRHRSWVLDSDQAINKAFANSRFRYASAVLRPLCCAIRGQRVQNRFIQSTSKPDLVISALWSSIVNQVPFSQAG